MPTTKLVILLVALLGASHAYILTGVAPGLGPEEPSFMYTNFGLIYGTRDLQEQFRGGPATDEINHHQMSIIGTVGMIPENVTPYQGDNDVAEAEKK
ncbi:uncharacterized protein LOC135383938 isoform X2 [Ornithodoros turicata]